MNEAKTKTIVSLVVLIALCMLLGWNYWLPTAKRYFSDQNTRNGLPNIDLYAYYIAGKAFDLGLNPYIDNSRSNPALSDSPRNGYSRYIYPPTMLPLYSLISRLDYKYARVLWVVFYMSIHFLALTLMALSSDKEERSSLWICGLLLTFTSHPLLFHIRQGQIDLIVIALVMISFIAYNKKLKLASVFLISLAVLIKVTPIMFLLMYVVFYRDIKYFVRLSLSLAILVSVSLVFVPFELYTDYVTTVLPDIVGTGEYFYNQSLIRLVTSIPLLPRLVSLIGFTLFAVIAWQVRKKYINSETQKLQSLDIDSEYLASALFLMNVLVILLFSDISWHMAYVWIILPTGKMLVYLIRRATPVFIGIVSIAIILLNAKIYAMPLLDSLNILGGMLLLCSLTGLVLRPKWVLTNAEHL